MRALFIVNPAAGHGRAHGRWQSIIERLRKGHKDTEVWFTRAPGDGAALAKRGLEQGHDALIAVGGDGTVGEVVHGFLTSTPQVRGRAVVGTWPAGSGCDTARHLGLRPDESVDRLLALLNDHEVRRFDAGRVFYTDDAGKTAERYFINMAAFGLAGSIARKLEKRGKRWGGSFSYLLSSLVALATARPDSLQLVADGAKSFGRFHLITLANSSSIGGGMRIADGADMQDGLLDMVTIGDVGRLKLLMNFHKIYTGTHLTIPGVTRRAIKRLEASSPDTVYLNIDGEALGRLPAVFEVVAGAVPFMTPRK